MRTPSTKGIAWAGPASRILKELARECKLPVDIPATVPRFGASNQPSRQTFERRTMSPIAVVLLAGSVCGVLDLLSATALVKSRGGNFQQLLQFVASGALGPSAFQRGNQSAAAGFLFHFLIAFTAATAYYATSRVLSILVTHAILCGMLYGAFIHLFMTLLIIPLSRAPKRKFSASAFISQLAVHMFVVGLSISLIVSQFS
jgi:hypothetical protein